MGIVVCTQVHAHTHALYSGLEQTLVSNPNPVKQAIAAMAYIPCRDVTTWLLTDVLFSIYTTPSPIMESSLSTVFSKNNTSVLSVKPQQTRNPRTLLLLFLPLSPLRTSIAHTHTLPSLLLWCHKGHRYLSLLGDHRAGAPRSSDTIFVLVAPSKRSTRY